MDNRHLPYEMQGKRKHWSSQDWENYQQRKRFRFEVIISVIIIAIIIYLCL